MIPAKHNSVVLYFTQQEVFFKRNPVEISRRMFLLEGFYMKFYKSFYLVALFSSVLLSFSAHALPPTNVSGLIGTWTNLNSSTGGIVKIEVTNTSSGLRFKSYGACHPTPCVHSTVVAYPHSASVSSNTATGFYAFRNNGFAYSRFAGVRTGQYLRLENFTTFASGDSRKNYVSTEYFKR